MWRSKILEQYVGSSSASRRIEIELALGLLELLLEDVMALHYASPALLSSALEHAFAM